jgi:hypothetical protein
MGTPTSVGQSGGARHHRGDKDEKGHAEGLDEGRQQGREEGRREVHDEYAPRLQELLDGDGPGDDPDDTLPNDEAPEPPGPRDDEDAT